MSVLLSPRTDGTPLVKICGLQCVADVEAAIEAGADLLGIVFAPSRRRLQPSAARALVAAAGSSVPVVGVFVNASVAEMNDVVAETGIEMVQLSGDHIPLDTAGLDVPFIEVVHTGQSETELGNRAVRCRTPLAVALLVDAWSPQGGGSGRLADWAALPDVTRQVDVPVFLAGGLSPANVAAAIGQLRPAGVDVSSGVELDGRKDPALMSEFVRMARNGDGKARHRHDA